MDKLTKTIKGMRSDLASAVTLLDTTQKFLAHITNELYQLEIQLMPPKAHPVTEIEPEGEWLEATPKDFEGEE